MPYAEDDAEYFFGRDRDREMVLDNLRAYRLAILYGPSGVGKSSLLHAGVVPHVREDGRRRVAAGGPPEDVVVAFGSWAEDPVAGLRRVIRDALDRLSSDLSVGLPSGSLTDVIRAAADRIEGSLLIVLDQFEEYFLYHPREGGPGSFDDEFVRALSRRDTPANFLVSIREDGLAKLDRFEGRIPNLLDNLLRIDHLDRAAAREAIERPVERWNAVEAAEDESVDLEPELVEAVLDGVVTGRVRVGGGSAESEIEPARGPGDQRIQTPYLQLVLRRLWDEERSAGSRVMRLATLRGLGGAEEIVATHLDEVMATFPRREQVVAAQVFRYLVTPSGTKISHRGKDLAEYAELPEAVVAPVLERLTREARILQPVGDSRYEIYHDALAGPILEWRARREEGDRRRQERRLLFATVLLTAIVISLLAIGKVLDPIELRTVSTRFSIRGTQKPPAELVVVGVDSKSFQDVSKSFKGVRLRRPFPHDVHAVVTDRLRRDGAKVIAFDIQFSDRGRNTDEQLLALVDAVERAGNVVVSTTEVDALGNGNGFGWILPEKVVNSRRRGAINDFLRRDAGIRLAHGGFPSDPVGVLRRMRYETSGLKTFAVLAAELASGERIERGELGGGGSAWIDFYGPPRTVKHVSYGDVWRGDLKPGTFRDKIVVVGATAPALQDLHPTSTSGDAEMAGPEIQANAIGTALSGFPLKDSSGALDVVLIVLLGLVAPVARLYRPAPVALALGLAVAGGYAVVAQLAFNWGTVLPVVYPLGALLISVLAVLFVNITSPHATSRRSLTASEHRVPTGGRRAP